MKYISLPDEKVRRLSFYLAMEEFVARRLDESDCFFMWQVDPSVIFEGTKWLRMRSISIIVRRMVLKSIAEKVVEVVSMRIWII